MAKYHKAIIRSRAIRRRLLDTLGELNDAAAGMAMTTDELVVQAQADSPFPASESELQAEIFDLANHNLIELDHQRARLASAGRDFLRAGLPWDRIDTFSGSS